ncbi:MAG TPA: ABC transporter substrate-binding protein [Xanthobacteraceae bacterium]|jgi:ABC-type nitrate/sulfonate/bicarbonate transport system substrate-binding protein|nr:ABC transporter substrate-binding protein [Xanthobacteraceae bacterium]
MPVSSPLRRRLPLLALALVLTAGPGLRPAAAQDCKDGMRKINIGVSVTPPNVVHTTPFVAKALGFFAKHCVDAEIMQFEGAASPAAKAAIAQGSVIINLSDVAIGRGLKAQQFWGIAPRLPQVYAVAADIKTAADLKGRKLSASGGGVGGFQWRMAREVLRTANLTIDDAQFISQGTAGRVPGLVAGQVDGVALHPEDMHLAIEKNPKLHPLLDLSKLLPNFVFNVYAASSDRIARDRVLLRDTAAAMIEANRTIYRDKEKVVPIIAEASKRPKESVAYAWDVLTRNCVWSVNEGFTPERTQWTIDYDVSIGDLDQAHKPTVEQVFNLALAREAVEAAGGRVSIGNCKE